MRRGGVFAATVFLASVSAPLSFAQPTAFASDASAELSLMAAAFTDAEVKLSPDKATAMAFLPGRGVVAWDVTGKTPEQAREAQIEAMGLADARAVQREIDEARIQREVADRLERRAFAENAGARRLALNLPAITGSARQTGGVLPINRAARRGFGLNIRNSDAMTGRPRLYAFAALSGRSVGLNVLHDDAGWKNAGLTADPDGHTGQRQAGVAWRKGAMQTSLSYVRQKSKTQILGMQSDKDHRLMLTVNLQPRAILGLFGKTP